MMDIILIVCQKAIWLTFDPHCTVRSQFKRMVIFHKNNSISYHNRRIKVFPKAIPLSKIFVYIYLIIINTITYFLLL